MTAILTSVGVIPLLWGCLILLFLLLLLLIGYLLWRARREANPAAKTTSADPAKKDKDAVSSAIAAELPESFSGAISTLRSRVSGPDFRYTLPWYLLIGAEASGKTSILSESSLSVALEEQVRVEQGAGLAWNFFENGIVIDVGGWAFSTTASAVSAWHRLLRLFVNNRAERPLDGILIAISSADLTGPTALSPGALIEQGAMLQQRLRQITQTIGFQLPVYCVLTKCDHVTGFTEFAAELETDELEQIFGWSNPHGTAAEFHPEWVDEAINRMRISLERKQSRLFALHAPNSVRGPMFLFPGAIYEVIPKLRLLLTRALRASGNVPAPMLRGIYCCGATSMQHPHHPESAKLVPVSVPSSNTSTAPSSSFGSGGLSWVPSLLEPWIRSDLQIAFTQDLLLKKVFAERGLAIPLAQHFAARDRLRLTLQIASAVTALILAVGTAYAYRSDRSDRDNILPLLSTIRTELQQSPSATDPIQSSASHTSASALIHAMASFETDGFRSWFMPASLFDPINMSISQAMVPAFRVLVLQRFHRGLEARIRLITDLNRKPLPNAALPPAAAELQPPLQLERTPEYLQMLAFTQQVADLQRFVDIYNNLSTKESQAPISSIIELDQYLHNVSRPVPEREASNPYFEQALREASWSPLVYTDDVKRQMSFKASQLTTSLYSAWIEHNPTRTATESLAANLDSLSRPSRHTYSELSQTKAAFDTATKTYSDPNLSWTAADSVQLPADLASVTTEAAAHSTLFQPWLHDWMLDLADEDFRKLASAIDNAQTPLTGNLVKAEDSRLQLSDRAAQVQVALENLMSLPFMSAGAMPMASSSRMLQRNFTWNKASLDAAAALPVSYERYLAEDLDQAPTALRAAFSRIAAEQLSGSLVFAIDEAEQPASPILPGSGPSAVALHAQSFETAESSISSLLATLQQNNLSQPLSRLRYASITQASDLLLALNRELDADHPFGVSTAALSRWTADGTPTSDIFDAPSPDAVQAYLAAQDDLVASYSTIAAPLVSFLRQYTSSLSPSVGKVVTRWQGITTAVDQHKAKRPGNSVQLIEDFIAVGADKVTPAKACQLTRPTMSPTRQADYFILEAAELRRDIVARCQVLLNESFTRNYNLLSSHFNRDLANRFPFAPPTSSTLYEADPALVAALFSQRDAAADILASGAESHANIRNFLAALQDSRPWFASLLSTATADQPPSLDFVPTFRVNRAQEVGGNQIIDWTLQVGSDTFHATDPERKGHWTYGEPIVFSLRWAKDAPFQPTSPAAVHSGYDLQVIGDTVTYTFKDPWSMLRYIRSFSPLVPNNEGPDAFILTFDIPESPAKGANLQPDAITSAHVFLRLLLSAPGDKQTIQTDAFPNSAPLLAAPPVPSGE
jgi:type VI secretion system protein ImpL